MIKRKKNKVPRAVVVALMVVVIRMMWRGVHIEKNEAEYVILVSYSTKLITTQTTKKYCTAMHCNVLMWSHLKRRL